MLRELVMTDHGVVERDKVQVSIDRLKAFEPPEGYYLAFSGGKDSVVLKALADMAGVKYDAHYSLTTVDPPELVRFIKNYHPDVEIVRPKETMWQLIVRNGVPNRMQRFCCKELKESDGKGRVTLTGVRWAESTNRKNNKRLVNIGGSKKSQVLYNTDNDEARRAVESCYRTQKTLVNPIIDWLDEDVWEFIRQYKIPYCSLYDEGWKRLGCIGCPMSNRENREKGFERWPTYKRAYIHAFDRMVARRRSSNRATPWQTGQECFDWWMQKGGDKQIQGQIDVWEDEEE